MEVVCAGHGWVMRSLSVAPRLGQVLPQAVGELPRPVRRGGLVGDPAPAGNDYLRTALLGQGKALLSDASPGDSSPSQSH